MMGSNDKALEYRGMLPFAVQPLAALPDAGALLVINLGNEQALRSVMMLEEKPDLDEDDQVMLELKRHDMKINLILDLLSSVLVQFNAMPASRELALTDSSVSYAEEGASISGLCEVQLYIEPSIPRPLKLFGVASFDPMAKRTVINFQGLSR